MNKNLSCIYVLIFSIVLISSSFAAPAIKEISLTRVQTVDDARKILFPYKAIPVASETNSESSNTSSSSYTPSEKYKTGSGIILTPANLINAENNCTLTINNVVYNYSSLAQMNDSIESFAKLKIPPLKTSHTIISSIAFGKMPREKHAYVLTLKIDKGTQWRPITININGTVFTGDQLLYNADTKEYRILFSFAPVTSQMSVLVNYTNKNQTTEDVELKFYYAQLIQLD